MELIGCSYNLLDIDNDINQFFHNCYTYQHSCTSRHAPFGVLCPLLIPNAAWHHISMDFITRVSWSNGFNASVIVVSRLRKIKYLISCRDT